MPNLKKVAKKLYFGYNIVVKRNMREGSLHAAYSPYAYPHEIQLKRVSSVNSAVNFFRNNILNNRMCFTASAISLDNKCLFSIVMKPGKRNDYEVTFVTDREIKESFLFCVMEDQMEFCLRDLVNARCKQNNLHLSRVDFSFKTAEERYKAKYHVEKTEACE